VVWKEAERLMKVGEFATRLFFSLRFRLLAIVLLGVIPALILILYTAAEQRRIARDEVQEGALILARLVASEHERLIRETRQLLMTLSYLPEAETGLHPACHQVFAELLKEYPQYLNLGVISADGTLVCSGASPGVNVEMAAYPSIQQAYEFQEFAAGSFQVDPLTGRPALHFALPVINESDHLQSIQFAALDLDWLNQVVSHTQLPEGAVLLVVDQQGVVLATSPVQEEETALVGNTAVSIPIVKHMLDLREGTAEMSGLDGAERLYGFTQIRNGQDRSGFSVGVGLSIETAFQSVDQNLYRHLTALSLVLTLALAVAWFGGDLFILKRVESLLGATRKLAAGDLSARTGVPYDQGELSQLAAVFDRLGEALERREIERKLVESEINRHIRDLSALNTITATVSSSLDLLEVLESLKRLLAEQFNIPGGAIFSYEEDSGELILESAWGVPAATLANFKRFYSGLFHYRSVIVQGETYLEQDFRKVEPYASAGLSAARPYLQSYLCIPLIAKGQVQGVIDMFSREYEHFQPEQLELFTIMGQEVGVAIQNARFFEEVNDARNRLRSLSQQLIELQENERRHIARELHDEIGQAMTAVKVNLQAIARLAGTSPLTPHLEESISIIDRTIQQIRNLSLDLRPSLLDDLGIVSALRWYVDRQAQRAELEAEFTAFPQDMRFSPALETTCFRIVQEAITNVVRHAKANQVSVEIIQNGVELNVVVRDDGVGFDLNALQERTPHDTTLGLLGMRERVELVGGRLEILSEGAAGTQIRACLPIYLEDFRSEENSEAAESSE
jgi:signal transduction histidine kinase/HAMP domain-containing protein